VLNIQRGLAIDKYFTVESIIWYLMSQNRQRKNKITIGAAKQALLN